MKTGATIFSKHKTLSASYNFSFYLLPLQAKRTEGVGGNDRDEAGVARGGSPKVTIIFIYKYYSYLLI